MTLIARKPQSTEQERLRGFVAEQLAALEPGLTVLETGLRLGRTVVDVVAGDAKQRLVLVGVAPVAGEPLLLAMLDAFIWCVQFPENLRRLYPDARLVFSRPPRLLIVAEQVPPGFVELLGHLSMVEVDCHELEAAERAEAVAECAVEPAAAVPEPAEPGPGLEPGAVIPDRRPEAPAAVTEEHTEAPVVEAEPATVAAAATDDPETRPARPEPSGRAAWARSAGHGANGLNGHHARGGEGADGARAAATVVAEEDVSWATSGAERLMAEGGDGRPAGTPHPLLASLSFPKGTVSRQWQEFLNRLASGQ